MPARDLAQSMSAHRRAQAVESFRTRVVWLAFARRLLAWTAGWLIAFGCVVLAWRAFHLPEAQLAWGLLGAIPAVLGAAFAASGSAPDPAAVLALLDARSGARGLMLLEAQEDLGPWENRLPPPADIALSWRPGASLVAVLLAGVFVGGAFFVPMPASAAARPPLDIAAPAGRIEAQVEELRQEKLLDEQSVESMKRRLKQLAADAQGENPAKTWEALDHLAAEVRAAGEKAAQELSKDADAADAAANFGAVLDAHADELSPEQAAGARDAQARREEEAFKEATDGGLPGVKPPPGLDIPADLLPKMTPQERAAMRQFLKDNREALRQMAQRMAQAGLCQNGDKPAGLTPAQMAKLLQDIKDGKCAGQGAGAGAGQNPGGGQGAGQDGEGAGAGGPGGGGSSAGLTWQDPATEEGVSFDPKSLENKPGAARDLKGSIKLGESAAAPTVDGKAQNSTGGGLAEGAQGGGSAAHQNVLPRHRKAVDTYFERK